MKIEGLPVIDLHAVAKFVQSRVNLLKLIDERTKLFRLCEWKHKGKACGDKADDQVQVVAC